MATEDGKTGFRELARGPGGRPGAGGVRARGGPREGGGSAAAERDRLAALRRDHEPRAGHGLVRHYLRDLVYGANDGIITTFAVVTGVAGAALPVRTALILGGANLLADGFSMGASSFLAIRSDEAVRLAAGEDPAEPFPLRHGLVTLMAFVLAGSVPLLPYALAPAPLRLRAAVGATLATLFVVGALRSAVTRLRWWRAGAEMLAVGAAAAAVSYGVGVLLARLT